MRPNTRRSRAASGVLAAVFALGYHGTASAAGTNGVAYDTIVKVTPNDSPTLRAKDFAADFRRGERPTSGCPIILVRRYLTTERERLDDVCQSVSLIVDCPLRRVVVVGHAAKTYTVKSLDAPPDPRVAEAEKREDEASAAVRAMMKSVLMEHRAERGRANIDDTSLDAFTIDRLQSTTSPNLSVSTRETWTYYFARTPLPQLACIDAAQPWLDMFAFSLDYEPEIAPDYVDRRLRTSPFGVRETVTGPDLPRWRIPQYGVGKRFQQQNKVPDYTIHFEVESGNVRPLADDDPNFSLPADYTATQ